MEHRVCITLPQGLSAHLQQLEQRTHAWFSAQPFTCAEDLLLKYYDESRRGSLKPLYATLIQHASDQKITIQPAITDCLTRAASATLPAPVRAVRLVLGMLTYWLSQYHSGQHRELPETREARDIIAGILQDTVISVG
ncbi:hypothetical protein [Kluyvera sp. CHPC 1.251]|uniref:hypothetical protein n=1 Tax=Kluyvera sp. CHPC 1.251 TaxID=2995175 RepID=UPI002FD84CEF